MAKNNEKFVSRENAKTLWGYMVDLLTGKYTKPSGGIPKSDLESSVQTSLGLADSALQSETDPTVPSWAKQSSKPSYTQDEVSDGSTYKRVTQTEKDTWSGKQNALTTTQMQAVNSGITSEKVTQISTNQTNILYGLNTGVKNKLPCKISNNNQSNDTGLKCNYNEDGTYTVTGTKSTSDSYLDIKNIYADKLNGDHVAYISVTGTGTCHIAAYGWNGTRYTMILSTSTSQGFNIGNNAYALFRIRFMDSVGTSYNATVKAMVCTMEAWNQSHDWQPPALPNQDLTVLEAEDRAALAEVVDSGAKNKAQTNTFTIDTDTGYLLGHKADLVAGQRYVVSYKLTAPNSGTLMLGLKNSSGTGLLDLNVNNGVGYAEFTCPTGFSYYNVQATKAGTFSDFMICTLADWKFSQKFVPYRIPYSQALTLLKQKAPSGVADYVASGSVNDLPSGCALCGPDVTGKPISDNYFIIRTRIYDSNCAEQEAIAPAGNRRFNRTKWGGTWTPWAEYTIIS